MVTAKERKDRPRGNRLLLLEDVYGVARKGEIVEVKPGYARNFLIPKKKAVVADANTIKLQARLQEERSKQAAIDKEKSEALASQLDGLTLSTHVKVDPAGHMYGSVSAADIVEILADKGFTVERVAVRIGHPLKTTGLHTIDLQLKEEVSCLFKLKVIPEGMDDLPEEPKAEVTPEQEGVSEQVVETEEVEESDA